MWGFAQEIVVQYTVKNTNVWQLEGNYSFIKMFKIFVFIYMSKKSLIIEMVKLLLSYYLWSLRTY